MKREEEKEAGDRRSRRRGAENREPTTRSNRRAQKANGRDVARTFNPGEDGGDADGTREGQAGSRLCSYGLYCYGVYSYGKDGAGARDAEVPVVGLGGAA